MRKKGLLVGILFLFLIFATVIRNRYLTQQLEADYGVEEVYYDMGQIVPFEQDYQTYGSAVLDGYSIRVDSAEVMTYEKFLSWFGNTDEVAELLEAEEAYGRPEKICLLTVTFFNEDCEAEGFYLNDFRCYSTTYCLYFDNLLTIYANNFLLEDRGLSAEQYYSSVGIYLAADSEVTMYLVYDYNRYDFQEKHWEYLFEDPMWFAVTWFPNSKIVSLTLN